jgi:hypothetical protein
VRVERLGLQARPTATPVDRAMAVKELLRGLVLRLFLSLLVAPWVFVLTLFGHRCFEPPPPMMDGVAGCLAFMVGIAPFYMAFGPLLTVEDDPPYGLHLWILTALVLAVLWQAVAVVAKRLNAPASK